MKKIIIFGIFILILISGCFKEYPETFKVKYHSQYSSSGGDRILDVVYTVKDGEIVSCNGTYGYPPSQAQQENGYYGQNIEECDVERLKAGQYNAPTNLIIKISKNQDMSGEIREGPSSYSWEIII